ncbi:MAG: IS3 family transposase [Candidatus Aminicenantes bacterium]|nr:IS3 family transposase [Candidatus Aminicenantes bacterium]
MTAWLRHLEGVQVNSHRVYRLMRENGLLVEQASRPNEYWGIDMTKFLLGSLGWCYLIVVLDWYPREIKGWNLSLRARTTGWKKALDRGLCARFPWGVRGQGLGRVSVNGSQPTSVTLMRDTAELGSRSPEEFYQQWVQSHSAASVEGV